MEENEECKLIQDLLLNYNDDVLNESTKKMVEKHLQKCENCKVKLEQIKNDIEKESKTSKEDLPQIDYLKKYKRNSTIKAVLSPIILLILILLVIYLYRFVTINNLINKYAAKLETENFYIEKISVYPGQKIEGKEQILKTKKWYKDGKYKIENDIITEYGTLEDKYKIVVDHRNKTVSKEYGTFTNKNKEDILIASNPIGSGYKSGLMKLGAPFYWSIRKDSKDIGRMYYVIKSQSLNNSNDSEIWVDMETGLPIMEIGCSSGTNYYENTHIPIDTYRQYTEYKYEFDNVAEEDVNIPEFPGYTEKEIDWNEEVEKIKANRY